MQMVREISTAILATDLSLGRDEFGMNRIKGFRKRKAEDEEKAM
jgi:hypothetical protein